MTGSEIPETVTIDQILEKFDMEDPIEDDDAYYMIHFLGEGSLERILEIANDDEETLERRDWSIFAAKKLAPNDPRVASMLENVSQDGTFMQRLIAKLDLFEARFNRKFTK